MGEHRQDLAHIGAAGVLTVRGDEIALAVLLAGVSHGVKEIGKKDRLHPLGPGREVLPEEEGGAEPIAAQQRHGRLPPKGQQTFHPACDQQDVGIEEDVQAVYVDVVDAQAQHQTAEPIEQQQPGLARFIAQCVPQRKPQTVEQQRRGAEIDRAEAVDGVPDQVGPLQKADVPERFEIL